MKNKNRVDTVIGEYEFSSIDELIEILERTKAHYGSEFKEDRTNLELDYSGCYYESDSPSIVIRSVWEKINPTELPKRYNKKLLKKLLNSNI